MAEQRDTEWISTMEAALRIGQTPQAIRNGIKAGKYDGHKVRDHTGKRWVWVVAAKSLPSADLAKQWQTLPLTDEDRKAIAEDLFGMLAPEVVSRVEPVFSEMAKQLGDCHTLLKKLDQNMEVTEESNEETKALRAKVEEYERAAEKKSWWRVWLGGKD